MNLKQLRFHADLGIVRSFLLDKIRRMNFDGQVGNPRPTVPHLTRQVLVDFAALCRSRVPDQSVNFRRVAAKQQTKHKETSAKAAQSAV
jgi:hypothetical protein